MSATLHLPILDSRSATTRNLPRCSRLASSIERALVRHPRIITATHWVMIAFYLALILIPPWLPTPPEGAAPQSSFVALSRFVIWCVWWPGVVLSMLGLGRVWCGLFCPEGALAAFVTRFGANRAIPNWMRWGGIPLIAFVGITIAGQVFEVDERPLAQLVILGGSTLAAMLVGLIYARRIWTWCRYLCPVSLLFGVFSRLGALHFHVDRERLDAWNSSFAGVCSKDPCPVQIHLPAMSTNRYCVMCFRCSGWRDAIHLDFRFPGKELLHIDTAEPLFWEVMFLFGGAIGLPLGVFYGERLNWGGLWLVALLLGCTLLSIAVLSMLTALSVGAIRQWAPSHRDFRRCFTCVGNLYTPLSLFSLFLGLSKPTFESLESIRFAASATDWIRTGLFALGVGWSLYVGHRILRPQTDVGAGEWTALSPHCVGLLLILLAWVPTFLRQ